MRPFCCREAWAWRRADRTVGALRSIRAWTDGLDNVQPPALLDMSEDWQAFDGSTFDMVYVSNLTHISPWESTKGLCRGAPPLRVR